MSDDLSALRDATETLTDLVDRLDAHLNGDGALDDDELEELLREGGLAQDVWQEAFRQSIIAARG